MISFHVMKSTISWCLDNLYFVYQRKERHTQDDLEEYPRIPIEKSNSLAGREVFELRRHTQRPALAHLNLPAVLDPDPRSRSLLVTNVWPVMGLLRQVVSGPEKLGHRNYDKVTTSWCSQKPLVVGDKQRQPEGSDKSFLSPGSASRRTEV
ncbi:hypothetical protein RRG08_038956 [Elysia crispata]|uniref:Uncharacterized protein n=1 Tax=Elysia crispata TaxID=231223 RepID=A0AAE1CU17_9GAST|nr:hypothetical protein RRG08_038956 [Elysia crispata]